MQKICSYIAPVEEHVLRSYIHSETIPDKDRIDLLRFSQNISQDVIYLASAEDIDSIGTAVRYASGASIFVACPSGEIPDIVPGESTNLIIVSLDISRLYTALNRVLSAYNKASMVFLQARAARSSLNDLIDSLSASLSIGVLLTNSGYQYIHGAIPEGFSDPYADELMGSSCLTGESIARLFGSNADAFVEGENGTRYCCRTLQGSSSPKLILILDRESPCDAEKILSLFEDYHSFFLGSSASHNSYSYQLTLGDVLSDSTLPEDWIRTSLSIPPDRNYYYGLLVVSFMPATGDMQKYNSLKQLLCEAFRNIRVTIYDGCIVGVLPIGARTGENKDRDRYALFESLCSDGWTENRFNEVLREYGAHACMISAVRIFSAMRDRYQLARDTMDIACKLPAHAPSRLYRFEEYQLYLSIKYGLDHFLQRYPSRAILMLIFPD
ncbi:MAG: hypothetical protein II784_03145, partial [Oscillospiraceae bacterium]|nr:hypothetical protein [Oscillospiraceae bacterium]